MVRWAIAILLSLWIVMSPIGTRAQDDNTAAAAKENFDQLQKQWVDLTVKLRQKILESRTGEDDSTKAEIQQLLTESQALIDGIVEAGLNVFRADSKSYPVVNKTLIDIASFYVTGDGKGDGGDQYDKAMPIVTTLLDAGAGRESPELWLIGAASAYQTNEFSLAEQYLSEARKAKLLGSSPPGETQDALINRAWESARNAAESLNSTRKAWEKEKAIREAEAEADDLPRVKLQTNRGDVVIELFENEAPQAVASFLTLVKKGFYDGVVFHRVLPGFMAQGGDPTGTGSGGPGYSIRCECHEPGYRKHFRGSLSMAHAGRNTGGSQFFLTFVRTTHLDGRHTVFGRVLEGMDVASSIKRRDPNDRNAPEPDRILKAEVLRDRGHAYEFEQLPER